MNKARISSMEAFVLSLKNRRFFPRTVMARYRDLCELYVQENVPIQDRISLPDLGRKAGR